MGVIAWIAAATHVHYILFPELGALAHDVIKRPRGTWAKAPGMLVLTPLFTGLAGTIIVRNIGSGMVPILLATAAGMLIIRVLKSPIAPAISAGVLPVSLNITSWYYPASLLVGLVLLVAISLVWPRFVPTPPVRTASDVADDITEEAPSTYSWLPFFLVFLIGTAILAEVTGWRLILFPPLIVIAFEMFAHADVCPWAKKPIRLPVACTLSALIGVALVTTFGDAPLAVIASTACGILILRVFDLHVPPALAVGLLPFIIPTVDYRFAASVGIGTLSLTMLFLVWRRLRKTRLSPS
ncbi:HPP family protein [Pseudomonas sp. GD03696]|uniref:HPP family protein n=1 Tax=Pseudomonas sp. GD03696 TaxID=2975368 RepID=UPI00244BBFC9|nr:HPP family protein [Pseudomonas sp. GD03696]MDH1932820.1 HPP family protein [Pseudomonas sp. GD03696]